MKKTVYQGFREINDHQVKVMEFIVGWVRTKKEPVPQKEIYIQMEKDGMKYEAVKWSLKVLLYKGYIRRGYAQQQNTTTYVQLRSI